jgi:hypothetical protein
MLFQEFIEQHRVDSFVAYRVWLSFAVQGHKICNSDLFWMMPRRVLNSWRQPCKINSGAKEARPGGQLGSCRALLIAAFAKEFLQDCGAFCLQNTGRNFTSMIEGPHL